mgnify:CR=1 FL=1
MANDKRINIFVTANTKNATKNLDKLERQSDETKQSASELSSTFRNLFGAAVLGAGARSVVQTASNFESLRTRLVALKGSTEEGEKAFNQFTKIAATTPFQVQNVVEAGATLQVQRLVEHLQAVQVQPTYYVNVVFCNLLKIQKVLKIYLN